MIFFWNYLGLLITRYIFSGIAYA